MDKHRLAITSAVVLGVAAGSYGIASAASGNGTTTTTPSTTQSAPNSSSGQARPLFPAHGTAAHEDQEKPVTGSAATKAKTAAVQAAGGGTAGEVTTDFTGDGYEVTVTKSDGTSIEIHLDSSFNALTGGPGGHGGPGHQRSDETVLTGDTAAKVTAAAKAKVPGGTVMRVETDGDGNAAYEAHMVAADGTPVTVYVDKDFNVVSVDTGGPGGHGFGGAGAPPQQSNGTA